MSRSVDMTGYEFGDYVVESFDNTKGKYKYYWNCRCKKCGSHKSIAVQSIKRNKSSKCNICNNNFGKNENVKGYSKNLVGQKFGSLTVVKFAYSKGTHSYWECLCDCGEICIKSITFLKKSINKMCSNCIETYSRIENVICSMNINKDGRIIHKIKFANDKRNKYEKIDGYIKINEKILIDESDLSFIDSFERYISVDSRGYAYFSYQNRDIYIHRLLTNVPLFYEKDNTYVCDHINGNRLDNRRSNLRIIQKKDNAVNCGKRKDNKSGYKGISWLARLNKWQVNIQFQKQNHYIGVFENFEDAVKARKEAEIKYFGELNRSNL